MCDAIIALRHQLGAITAIEVSGQLFNERANAQLAKYTHIFLDRITCAPSPVCQRHSNLLTLPLFLISSLSGAAFL